MHRYVKKSLSLVLAATMMSTSTLVPITATSLHKQQPMSLQQSNPSLTKWRDKLEQYIIYNDKTAFIPYEGFHFDTYGLMLGEGETLHFKMLDDQGNDVTDQLEWYVFTNYPFTELFDHEKSNDDTIPPYMSGGEIDIQRTSLVRLNEPGSITARSIAGKQSTLNGWIVGVYQDTYAHVVPVNVKRGPYLSKLEAVEQEIAPVLHEIRNMNELDQAAYVFQYILDRVRYDYGFTHNTLGNPDLHKTLIEQWAVCDGYAHAYEYIMQRAGFLAEYQFGEVLAPGGQGETLNDLHAWNRIFIDDGWYYMDTTWADKATPDYRYMFASRNSMVADRVLPDDGTNAGVKHVGYYPLDPNAEYRTDQSVAQQVRRIKDTLSQDTKEVLIFISQDEDINNTQYEIPNMISDPAKGVTCGDGIPKYVLGAKGVVFSYPITFSSTIQPIAIKDRHELIVKDHKPYVRITLDQDVALTNDNVTLRGATFTEKEMVKVSNREYLLPIAGIIDQSFTISLKKTGYQFPTSHTIELGNRGDVETPQAQFIGTDYNKGILTNLSGQAEYNVGDGVWIPVTTKETMVKLTKWERDFLYKDNHATVYVRNRSDVGTYSDIQQIRISRPVEDPTWVKKTIDTTEESKVVGVINMEYRLKGSDEWKLTKANEISNLSKGVYQFRVMGMYNRLASEITEITIEHFEGAKQPVINKDALQEAISIAQTKKQDDYTEKTWLPFVQARNRAVDVVKKEDVTQAQINDALDELNKTMQALESIPAQVKALIKQIDALGAIDLSKENDVKAARAAFMKLSLEEQAMVTNIDKLKECEDKLSTMYELVGAKLSVDGNIAVKIYYKFSEEMVKHGSVSIRVANAEPIVLPINQARLTKNGYEFIASVTVRQMSDMMKIQVMKDDQKIGQAQDFSVRMYADLLLEDEHNLYPEDAKNFAKAMLYHGAAMQVYKKYNVHNLATDGLQGLEELEAKANAVNPDALPELSKAGKAPTGLELYGISLNLEDVTSIRYFFTKTKDYDPSKLTFDAGSAAFVKSEDSRYVYIDILDIPAHHLDRDIKLVVSDNKDALTIISSPLSYARLLLKDEKQTPEAKKLVRSLVIYNEAANKMKK